MYDRGWARFRELSSMWPRRLMVTGLCLDDERRLARPAHASVEMAGLGVLSLLNVSRVIDDLAQTIHDLLAQDSDSHHDEVHSKVHDEVHTLY